MGVFHSPETAYGKELWRWDHTIGEANPVDPTIKGMRPISHQMYPAMMYRVTDRNPLTFDREIVDSETQQSLAEKRGFVAGGQGKALEAYDAQQKEYATIAAHRNYEDRKLGEKAKAEADAYESEQDGHVAVIPEVPVKRKYTRKAVD